MSVEAVARRYARAFFEVAKESGSAVQIAKDLGEFAEAWSTQAELRAALDSPRIGDAAREALVKEVATRMSFGDGAVRALRLLAQRRRLAVVPELAREVSRLADEDGGVVRAHVTSASGLPTGYLDQLRAEIERSTGKKVTVTHSVDASLLAGVVTRIGDRVVDGSAKTRLRALRDAIRA
jgi:F-type H+-transporting ATPase subunit delta